MPTKPTNSTEDSSPSPSTPESVEVKPVENKPADLDAPAKSDYVQGDPVEFRSTDRGQDTPEKWRKGRYQAYFPQYGYHAVRLADGSTWQGASEDIRVPGEDTNAVDR